MDSQTLAAATREAAKPRFHGHSVLRPKFKPAAPDGIAREYVSLTNEYMALFRDTIKKYAPEIKAAAREEWLEQNMRFDDAQSFFSSVRGLLDKIGMEFELRARHFDLRRRLVRLGNAAKNRGFNEWRRLVKSALGIDLFKGYYKGEFYRAALARWVDDNVNLIKTVPQNTLGRMREAVKEGYMNGLPASEIMAAIQEEYGIGKRHARFIARDQIAKLNADIAESQQRDAGVTEYIWSTSLDERVRDRHAELEGKRFRWDDPPVVDERTGRREPPGRDYACRCVALPVFDINSLILPMSSTEKGA